jgi:hypothetical protein
MLIHTYNNMQYTIVNGGIKKILILYQILLILYQINRKIERKQCGRGSLHS